MASHAPGRRIEELRDALAVTRADLARLVRRGSSFLASLGDRTPSDIEVYGAGAVIHGYYNTLERWMERVARDLNSGPPAGPDSHRLLLRAMALDRPGCRPPLWDDATTRELSRYLGFRHLFRHLYVLDLRWDEVRPLLVELEPLHRRVDDLLNRFDRFLADLLAQLESAAD